MHAYVCVRVLAVYKKKIHNYTIKPVVLILNLPSAATL